MAAAARVAELIRRWAGPATGLRDRPRPPGPEPDVHVFRSAAQGQPSRRCRASRPPDRPLPWRDGGRGPWPGPGRCHPAGLGGRARPGGRCREWASGRGAGRRPTPGGPSARPRWSAWPSRALRRRRHWISIRTAAGASRAKVAVDLLTSAYGGADAVTLRRLRRAVRHTALDDGRGAPADVLLAAVPARPGDAGTWRRDEQRHAALGRHARGGDLDGGNRWRASPRRAQAAWSAAEIMTKVARRPSPAWPCRNAGGPRSRCRDRRAGSGTGTSPCGCPGQIETFLDQVARIAVGCRLDRRPERRPRARRGAHAARRRRA